MQNHYNRKVVQNIQCLAKVVVLIEPACHLIENLSDYQFKLAPIYEVEINK